MVINYYDLIYIKSNSYSPLPASLGFVSKQPQLVYSILIGIYKETKVG